jgi:hypothetical protein
MTGIHIGTLRQIFTSQDIKAGVRFDDRSLIADLKQIDAAAANRYLEHAVVQRRSVVSGY